MQFFIDCDHNGVELKKAIISWSQQCKIKIKDLDFGIEKPYPLIANNMALQILTSEENYGILICKTGIGMSIVANKHCGIYANACNSCIECSYFRKVNNGNLLCLGAQFVSDELAIEICDLFIHTNFDSRNKNRLEIIESIFPRENIETTTSHRLNIVSEGKQSTY